LTLRIRYLDTITAETVNRTSLQTTTTRSRAVRPDATLPSIGDTRIRVTRLDSDGLSAGHRARGVDLRRTIAAHASHLTGLSTRATDRRTRRPAADVPTKGNTLISVTSTFRAGLDTSRSAVGILDSGAVGRLTSDEAVLEGTITGLRAFRPIGGFPVEGDALLSIATT